MRNLIENPATCEVHVVIPFLHVKKISATEIHCHIIEIYGKNVVSDSKVWKWCQEFPNSHTKIHDVADLICHR